MVLQAKLCQNILFLSSVYGDKELANVHKISLVLCNVCIVMKCYIITGNMLALVLY